MNIAVNRDRIIECVADLDMGFKCRGSLNVKFVSESGIDAGGLSREFFNLLGEEINGYKRNRRTDHSVALGFLSANPEVINGLLKYLGGNVEHFSEK